MKLRNELNNYLFILNESFFIYENRKKMEKGDSVNIINEEAHQHVFPPSS